MKLQKHHIWPIGVVGALAINVIANVFVIRAANQPGTEVVERDYYRKAVAWDSTLAQREQSAALGWTLDAALARLAPGRALVSVTLAGPDGAPLPGAEVDVEAIHNLDAGHPVRGRLAATGGGYGAELPMVPSGLWELRFEVRHEGRTFTTTMRRECPRPT